MHRTFKKLLPDATGSSEWVVAVNADIRGFTSRMSANPAETALYLKKVYGKILDNYFSSASFFKPTGDGLLVVIPFIEEDLEDVSTSVINDAVALVQEFGSLVAKERLIRFSHPDHMGIGLSAGSVARLATKRTTLDYTGRPLNVASRLMDLARPSGVVFDNTLDVRGVSRKIIGQFGTDEVYLKGVAEGEPLEIRFTSRLTEIGESYRIPVRPDAWHSQMETLTFAAAKQRAGMFRTHLEREPANRQKIAITIRYPHYKGGKRVPEIEMVWEMHDFEFRLEGERPVVRINYDKIIDRFRDLKMPGRTIFSIEVGYPVALPSADEAARADSR